MTSPDSKPPLASMNLRLPFNQLSPADFERLCLWLVRREGFRDVEYLGEAGSEQGRDLLARRGGRRFAFQCKRVQRFTAADARHEVAKIRSLPAGDQPEELIFVVTKAVRAATRTSAREAWGDAETCRFWCGAELDERVKRHPKVLAEFFNLGGSRSQGTEAGAEDPAIAAYRDWAAERHAGIDLIGLGAGEVKLRLEEVYVPLGISHRAPFLELEMRRAKRRGELAWEHAAGNVELEEIFSAGGGASRAVIFGEPGAGKTTALKKLHHLCLSEGPEALGLEQETLPLLVPLRWFRSRDLDLPLPEMLDGYLSRGTELPSGIATKLWRSGRLLLLLDGLDEIAEDGERGLLADYLESELDGDGVRVAVSCRYSGYGGPVRFSEDFLHLDIRPLDAAQVRRLVRTWFRAAARALPRYSAAEARQSAQALVAALDGEGYSSQQLKVLVGSPLLLTLMCVVVLRGGEMPRQRVAFYGECLRVLLGRWGKAMRRTEPALEVETALAVLRPLAYELHAAGRRDDFSKVEAIDHIEMRLAELDASGSPFRILEWLHRECGVLEEYAPQCYGFMHLGLQEYLAAAHVESHAGELLGRLAADFGKEWWREVILLLMGLSGRSVFRAFIEQVVGSDALTQQADLVRECFAEAPDVDLEPVLELLDSGVEEPRQAAALRLLRGRCDPRIIGRARALAAGREDEVGALARRLVSECESAPEAESRHDLFIAHHPSELAAARQLSSELRRRGLNLFGEPGSDWQASLEELLASTRGVAVVIGATEAPWERPEVRTCLRMFSRRARPLVPVWLAGADQLRLPKDLPWAPPVDLRMGLEAVNSAVFEQALAGSEPEVAANAARASPGEALSDPVAGIRWLWVPGGRFQLGDSASPHGDEKPAHWVRISPFWLGETPVTNRQYSVFLEQSGYKEPALWRDRRFSGEDQPVVGVSWHDAVAYCQWLSRELPDLDVSLPSEAQWELAARGEDGREYPWGGETPDETRACFGLDWQKDQPAAVGSFPEGRGPFGNQDMAGNVWEWCLDAWSEDSYAKRAELQEEELDPVFESSEVEDRVLRGGGWSNPAEYLRAAYRYRPRASRRIDVIGFRVLAAPAST